MKNKIKRLLESIQKNMNSGSSTDHKGPYDLRMMHTTLKDIKKLLILTLIKDELLDLPELLEGSSSASKADAQKEPHSTDLKTEGYKTQEITPENRKKAIESLEDITTTKTKEGVKYFLLHRPTENFEYSDSAELNEFETKENTDWFAEYMSSEINQEGQNPVVSCWVPEEKILGSEKPHSNTGAWGELGKNPFADVFSVLVKPGKYEIYQELKQRR